MRPRGAQQNQLHRSLLRLGWLVCALLSLCLFAAGTCSLTADLYLSVAEPRLSQSVADRVAFSASELATRIAPWKAEAWTDYAISAAQSDNISLALSAASQSIYWAPADPEKWEVMAQIRMTGGRFDQSLDVVTSNVSRLTPNSPRWRKQLALDGVYWWSKANDPQRRIWLDSMRSALAYDQYGFLVAVLQTRRENDFCGHVAKTLRLSKWCEWAVWSRRVCNTDKLTQEQSKYCNVLGFGTATKR